VAALAGRLGHLNPGIAILPPQASPADLIGAGLYDLAQRPQALSRWLAEDALPGHHHHDHHHDHAHGRDLHDVNRHDASIRAFALTAERPVARTTFELFWTLLRSIHGPRLLRLKGLVDLAGEPGRPLLVHAVQQILHPPVQLAAWPDGDHRSRLVLIARDVEEETVRKLWSAFLGEGA
jgi:G3E family GTPase